MVKKQNKSVGELSTVLFLEKLFKKPFPTIRPDWLKNPKTGFNLELDGFCKELGIAVEYGSHNPSHHNSHMFKDQKTIKYRDNLKKKICQKLKIKLIHVPDLNLKKSNFEEEFKNILVKEFARLDIKIPANFNTTRFVIVERLDAYTVKEVWNKAKSCKNRNQFERKFRGYWRAAERLGIILEVIAYFKGISKKRDPLSIEDIAKDAKKCKTRAEFYKRFPGSYKKALSLKIIDKVCSTLISPQVAYRHWHNWKNILKHCKTKQEVKKYHGFIKHMAKDKEAQIWYNKLRDKNQDKIITFKDCYTDALKFKTKGEWQVKANSTYLKSLRSGWHKKCTKHMLDSSIVRSCAQKKRS